MDTIQATVHPMARTGAVDAWLELFVSGRYSRRHALELIEAARATCLQPPLRGLATLVLEQLILCLPSDEMAEIDTLLVALGLKERVGGLVPLRSSVLREGYTSTRLEDFALQLRRRLQRLGRLHQPLRERCRGDELREHLLHLASQECRLTLSRYLAHPGDVARRIQAQFEHSRGRREPLETIASRVQREAERYADALPELEADVVRALRESEHVLWASESTATTLNALVETPIGTVVTVIKPPGSTLELEVKRTGMRTPPLLDVIYRRDGEPVPATHRLQGGSIGAGLVHEAKASATLSQLYRRIHRRLAPTSRLLALRSIHTVPTPGGQSHVLDYFSDGASFGAGFEQRRAAIARAVAAFDAERQEAPLPVDGALGLASRFLAHTAPAQAILAGTSSLRLERLALYLSPNGPRAYFTEGLGLPYSTRDARRLADDLLVETLGVYKPPSVCTPAGEADCGDYARYVDAAFAERGNRARADAVFVTTMEEVGRLWGTLVAVGAHSCGESFVARNVGIKSVWEDAAWRVQILFMDHDSLQLGTHDAPFDPLSAAMGMALDATYIFGWQGQSQGTEIKGSTEYLEEIYRASPELRSHAQERLFAAARQALRSTQDALLRDREVQRTFHPAFAERSREWLRLLASYFDAARRGVDTSVWDAEARHWLGERSTTPALVDAYLLAARRFADQLRPLADIL